ncbi:MAG TPA: transaldolase [Anaerolineaceae bacterium]
MQEMHSEQNPLLRLESFGQSIWLDFISRDVIESGNLKCWIDEDGLSGVTSNPSIFEKAMVNSHTYDNAVDKLVAEGKTAVEIFGSESIQDIQRAADLFRPVYNRKDGKDGFFSVEVSPGVARDTQASLEEARGLWKAAARPNVFVKVPGTKEGLPVIEQLISEGVNVNITLLFGLPRYREVVEAYLSGLETRVKQGLPIERVASVASFFLSRIDTLVDPKLEAIQIQGGENAALATRAHGQVAIACAKIAYEIFHELTTTERFVALAEKGARVQRLLWASTSTKNPAYSDVKYVDALIGPDTIDTIPLETLDAYRDHGDPALRLTEGLAEAHEVLDSLPRLGIDIDQVTQQLEDEGIQKFSQAYNQLMDSLEKKRLAVAQAQK